jgi:hypothetical protein
MLSPTRTTEIQAGLHDGAGTDSEPHHGQSHVTTGSTGPTYNPTRAGPRRTNFSAIAHARAGRGARPLHPAATAQSKAFAPTTARNSKPLWYPIHSTASEGSPPDQPRLGFRHSRRTLRNLQAGLRRISRRQPGDPTSAYTHLTVWAGRRDSESPPTSAP